MIIDLHIHSKDGSDGFYTLEQIFEEASARNIELMSITDHDSIATQERAVELAAEHGIKYLVGIELNVTFSPLASPQGSGIYDDRHAGWIYQGAWLPGAAGGAYDGTFTYSSTEGGKALFVMMGNRFEFTYLQHPARGVLDIYIDGVKVHSLNQNGPLQWQTTWTQIAGGRAIESATPRPPRWPSSGAPHRSAICSHSINAPQRRCRNGGLSRAGVILSVFREIGAPDWHRMDPQLKHHRSNFPHCPSSIVLLFLLKRYCCLPRRPDCRQ